MAINEPFRLEIRLLVFIDSYIYIYIYMKGPNPKSGICNDFVKVAFSVIEALKNTQIDTCLRYITVLLFNIYFAFGSEITIDLKFVRNSPFWLWTLYTLHI